MDTHSNSNYSARLTDTFKFNDFDSSQAALADELKKARETITKESLGYNSDER